MNGASRTRRRWRIDRSILSAPHPSYEGFDPFARSNGSDAAKAPYKQAQGDQS